MKLYKEMKMEIIWPNHSEGKSCLLCSFKNLLLFILGISWNLLIPFLNEISLFHY